MLHERAQSIYCQRVAAFPSQERILQGRPAAVDISSGLVVAFRHSAQEKFMGTWSAPDLIHWGGDVSFAGGWNQVIAYA